MPRKNHIVYDLTGKIFSRLTVIKWSDEQDGRSIWDCVCICGKKVTVESYCLRKDLVKSCGCSKAEILRYKKRKAKGFSGMVQVYNSYKGSAKAKRLEWEINLDYFAKITKQNCNYCGSEPSATRIGGGLLYKTIEAAEYSAYTYTGIDRVDSNAGYVIGNLVPCCKTCNIMKKAHSKDFFIGHIRKIANNLNKENI